MQKPEKRNNYSFVDYIPAVLSETKTWYVVYYIKNPYTQKLERKRNRVSPLKNITLRRKLGKKMVNEINRQLAEGWNPYNNGVTGKAFTPLINTIDAFRQRTKIEYEEGNFRFDTFKTYNSQLNQLDIYINEVINKPDLKCLKFNSDFVTEYLDYIRYEKKRSARTRDNYLNFLRTFSGFLLSKKYIETNPTEHLSKVNRKTKTRTIISDRDLRLIFNYWQENNVAYLTLCLTCYFCLVRRTEITKIRVSDISIANNTLYIDSQSSKNRKSSAVTIPDTLIPYLENHISQASAMDFLFSNHLTPGKKQLSPDMVTKRWGVMRKELSLDNNIHWYSLKDTGITHLLRAGIPLISVRDQARHHSSSQTDAYTPREIRIANKAIKTAELKDVL